MVKCAYSERTQSGGIPMSFDYLKQKRIMLVDDEQELLDLVASILKEEGFTNVQTAKP